MLLVILYAYFSQAARGQAADRIYVEAHQRIDLALVRGRCGPSLHRRKKPPSQGPGGFYCSAKMEVFVADGSGGR